MREFVDWEEYSEKVQFIEDFYWQQRVRKMSLKNI